MLNIPTRQREAVKGKRMRDSVLSVVSGLHSGLGTYPSPPPGVRVGEVLDVKFLENMLI